MTEEEIEAAKTVKKEAIKAYVNDPDPDRSLKAIKILLSAVINNAGSLENLTMINAVLDSNIGPTP